jgi:hypothetical protein
MPRAGAVRSSRRSRSRATAKGARARRGVQAGRRCGRRTGGWRRPVSSPSLNRP